LYMTLYCSGFVGYSTRDHSIVWSRIKGRTVSRGHQVEGVFWPGFSLYTMFASIVLVYAMIALCPCRTELCMHTLSRKHEHA
jgi:hypothetical protein